MQFDNNKLKGKIKEKELTQEEVAKHLDIAPSTFSNKINGMVFFNQDEIQRMAELLNIQTEDYKEYFFTYKV